MVDSWMYRLSICSGMQSDWSQFALHLYPVTPQHNCYANETCASTSLLSTSTPSFARCTLHLSLLCYDLSIFYPRYLLTIYHPPLHQRSLRAPPTNEDGRLPLPLSFFSCKALVAYLLPLPTLFPLYCCSLHTPLCALCGWLAILTTSSLCRLRSRIPG